MAKEQEFKEFESNTLSDFRDVPFSPSPIAWINVPQINQAISVET